MVVDQTIDVQFLQRPNIRMKHPEYVFQVLRGIAEGGPKSVQFILDFDNTMTRVHDNGKPCACSWQVLGDSDTMPQKYKDETDRLKAKYYPMEIDPHMSIENKTSMAVEWFSQAHEVLLETGLNKQDISSMVQKSSLKFRDGMPHMLEKLHGMSVPVLVFSAGLGDLINAVLETQSCYYDNIKVVSNFMKFSDDGTMVGFHDQLIHMYNKNEKALKSSSYFEELRNHNNIVLMGDNIGDLNMSDGISNINQIIKIGFLNHFREDRLEKYLEAFDIVVIDDQSMDIGNQIVNLL